MRAAQVQRAESKRLRIEARLRPACWDLQQEFAADWKAMPAMAEGVQAFLIHAVALPYGSSVSLPPYWGVDAGDNESHGDSGMGDTSIPAHDRNLRTGCEIGAALGAAAVQLTTAARVKRSLLLGARMWADTNYDPLSAALRPRRPPSKDDYVPPGRGTWRYGGLHDEDEGQHTGTPSTVTLPYTEMWGDRRPPLPGALFGNGGDRGNPCPEAVLQHLACSARPPPPRDAPPRDAPLHLHAPQPCGSGYDPCHAPSPPHPGPYGTPPHAPPPRLPPTFDGPPQPPPQHPHPLLHQHAHLRLHPSQVPFVPHPHPAAYPQPRPLGGPPSHLHGSLHAAPPHHAPPPVEWSARPAPPEPPQPQLQPPLPPFAPQQPKVGGSSPPTGTAAVPSVSWDGHGAGCRDGGRGCDGWEGGGRIERRKRSLNWEQRGRGRSRSRSSSPSPQGRSLHRQRRSPPSRSRSHSHSRGGRHSPRRQWDSDRSPIGRGGSERRGREYRRV